MRDEKIHIIDRFAACVYTIECSVVVWFALNSILHYKYHKFIRYIEICMRVTQRDHRR